MHTSPASTPTTRSVARRAASSEEGGILLTAVLVVAALAIGAVLGGPWYRQHRHELTSRLPKVHRTTPSTTSTPSTTEPTVVPALRAGRHVGFDRLVVTGVSSCEVLRTSIDADGSRWLRIDCDEDLRGAVGVEQRPVDRGLADVTGWYVDQGTGELLVHVVPDTETGTPCAWGCRPGRWVIDLHDPA